MYINWVSLTLFYISNVSTWLGLNIVTKPEWVNQYDWPNLTYFGMNFITFIIFSRHKFFLLNKYKWYNYNNENKFISNSSIQMKRQVQIDRLKHNWPIIQFHVQTSFLRLDVLRLIGPSLIGLRLLIPTNIFCGVQKTSMR